MGEGKSSVIVPVVATTLADPWRLVRITVAVLCLARMIAWDKTWRDSLSMSGSLQGWRVESSARRALSASLGWSQAAYVHPKANQHSVHRSQLDFTKDKVRRLRVLNEDGTTIELSEPKKLKLAFTGGTDDLLIEISLRSFGPPSQTESIFPTAIIYKFSASPSSKSDVIYNSRKVKDF
jgi:hypothetical protein